MVGRQIGSYQILSLLGAGGMGEVYRARDTKLDRIDALKVLPAEVASDQDRMRRFIREARAASALKHPNVATIYEIGESVCIHFIAMEYVEGQTLAARHYYRPTLEAVAQRYASQFPTLKLLTLADIAGDWHSANKAHFADGGLFDQIFQPGR